LSHGAGLYNIIFVKAGAKHVVPNSGKFDPLEVLKLSSRFISTCMFLAPTMVNKLVRSVETSQFDGEGIRSIIYGGGPTYLSDIIQATEVFGPRLIQIFGQGECPMAISVLKRNEVIDRQSNGWMERLSSVGKKQSVVDVVVQDHEGNILLENQIGELCVCGPPVMLGYWRDPFETQKTLINGWLKTGDLGRIDGDGYITLEGRSKDLIISGGSNIYPREVEDVLVQNPNVIEAAVVGKKDSEWGEIVVAFVVGFELTVSLLDTFCLKKIARFKRPKEYIFLDSLPKNNYGKVLKVELRKKLANIEGKI
jgi:long-chain acyl-CoA synthetase